MRVAGYAFAADGPSLAPHPAVRLEHLPLILGILVGLLGLGLVADSVIEDGTFGSAERRRRRRAPRHPRGEMLVGLGVLALSAALIGADRWRWGTVSVLAGLVLVTAGALLNRHYIAELFFNRGALSRTEDGHPARQARTERVVRRPVTGETPPGEGVDPPGPKRPPGDERRTTPRGGDGPRRIR